MTIGGGTGARELAFFAGKLGRRAGVCSAPRPKAALNAVDAKGEVAVGESLVRAGAGDPVLGISRVEGPALAVADVEEENEEGILRGSQEGAGRAEVAKGHRGAGVKGRG